MKNEKISLRCSNEEKEKIRKEAEERNLSISDYMIKKVCYETKQETDNTQKIIYEHRFYSLFNDEYYGAAEPPVRCGESHLSGLTEPPHFVY